MANITVRQTIELSVDLNCYYASFSQGLRQQIDKAVLQLASGAAKPPDAVPAGRRLAKGIYSTKLPDDSVVWYTNRRPHKAHGPVARIVAELRRATDRTTDKALLLKDLRDIVEKELQGSGTTTARLHQYIRNLIKDGYIRLTEPV